MVNTDYVTMADAITLTGLTRATIYGWARRGKIRRITMIRKTVPGGKHHVWYHLGDITRRQELAAPPVEGTTTIHVG